MGETTASQNEPLREEVPFREIRKRDGRVVVFEPAKITDAIFKAVQAVGGSNREIAENLTWQVVRYLKKAGYGGIDPSGGRGPGFGGEGAD